MIFVDTGFLHAFVAPRDALHGRAVAWSLQTREELVVTEYVLVEFANACRDPTYRSRCRHMIDRLRNGHDHLSFDAGPELLDAGLQLYFARPDKRWSLTDCISFALMNRLGIKDALAFDHHFEQSGFRALLRTDPA